MYHFIQLFGFHFSCVQKKLLQNFFLKMASLGGSGITLVSAGDLVAFYRWGVCWLWRLTNYGLCLLHLISLAPQPQGSLIWVTYSFSLSCMPVQHVVTRVICAVKEKWLRFPFPVISTFGIWNFHCAHILHVSLSFQALPTWSARSGFPLI